MSFKRPTNVMVVWIKTRTQLFPKYYYYNSDDSCVMTRAHVDSLHISHVTWYFLKKITRSQIFLLKLQGYTPLHIFCMYNLNVISSTRNRCCFIWIEVPSPYPKIQPTINHFLGYCVVFHQRIRYIKNSHAGYVFAKVRWRRDTCT